MAITWTFQPSFDPVRRERLAAFDTFAKVTDVVSNSATIEGAWICEATDLGSKVCLRPSVSLAVSSEAFDAFFNSAGGYRAQYLTSPENGQAANGALLRELEPRLTSAVLEFCGSKQLPHHWIRNAFLANSAKVWPKEDELDFLEMTHDLDVAKWKDSCDSLNAPAGAGLWAPEGTRLMVLGAFIDPWGNEVVARTKICRRFEIHGCGFT